MADHLSGFCIRATSRCGGGGGTGTKCGRWNPTTEQVKILTELFRSGLRTPSTDQIQKISSHLSFYGKIESKNVFYWFQNHKARERQKRRRVSVDDGRSVEFFDPEHHINPISEMNQVCSESSEERAIETLQLFPLNCLSETDSERMRLFAEDCYNKKNCSSAYDYCNKNVGIEMDIPTLDLRLSFI